MSSSQKRVPDPPSARSTVVSNPYAKKRQRPATGPTSTNATAPSRHDGGGGFAMAGDTILGGMAVHQLQPVTFSQAFPSLDGPMETAGSFNNPSATSSPPLPRGQAAAAAAQPALSEQELAERRAINFGVPTGTSANDDGAAATGDVRDYHLQLQPHVLYVSTRQKGNGLLKYIRNVPFAFSQMLPDYIVSSTTCALFLSIKYHQLYPRYVHRRVAELRGDFKVRVLLVLADVDDSANSLLQLNRLGVTNSLTVIVAWSDAEAARYLETYKALDGRDATSIQKRESTNVVDQMTDVITACKPCTKTDAASLWQHFGTLSAIADRSTTTRDELSLCPGLGPVKVQRLWDALHKPFSKQASRRRRQLKRKRQMEEEEQKQQEEVDDGDGDAAPAETTGLAAAAGSDDANDEPETLG
jgi:DNA excision repair protein ERCC-1